MNLFRRKQVTQVRVIHSTSMRLDQWRASPDLVRYAQQLFATPQFQTLISVLRNESPSSYGLGLGATHDDQIAHSYKAAGYNLCMNNLEAFARQEMQVEPLEATFEPEQPRKQD